MKSVFEQVLSNKDLYGHIKSYDPIPPGLKLRKHVVPLIYEHLDKIFDLIGKDRQITDIIYKARFHPLGGGIDIFLYFNGDRYKFYDEEEIGSDLLTILLYNLPFLEHIDIDIDNDCGYFTFFMLKYINLKTIKGIYIWCRDITYEPRKIVKKLLKLDVEIIITNFDEDDENDEEQQKLINADPLEFIAI